MAYKHSEDQITAINTFIEFLKDDSQVLIISGSAGTGKTFYGTSNVTVTIEDEQEPEPEPQPEPQNTKQPKTEPQTNKTQKTVEYRATGGLTSAEC